VKVSRSTLRLWYLFRFLNCSTDFTVIYPFTVSYGRSNRPTWKLIIFSNFAADVNAREWSTCTSRCSNHTVTCPVLTATSTIDGFSRSLDLHSMRSGRKPPQNRLIYDLINTFSLFICNYICIGLFGLKWRCRETSSLFAFAVKSRVHAKLVTNFFRKFFCMCSKKYCRKQANKHFSLFSCSYICLFFDGSWTVFLFAFIAKVGA